MQVHFNSDDSLEGHEARRHHAEEVVRHALNRFGEQITRVEIHVSDVNGSKTAEDDKRCLMEARLAGRQPIAVTEMAGSLHQAIDGAAQKLRRSIESVLGKSQADRRTPPPPSEDLPESRSD